MRDKTIALAGVFQSALIAHELANSGEVRSKQSWHTSLDSLYKIDAESTEAVFDNNMDHLSQGFNTLIKAFSKDAYYMNVLKYTLTLLSLESKLKGHPRYLQEISKGIESSKVLQHPDDKFPPAVISKLANIYSSTVSMLHPRVIISGKPFHLKQTEVTEKIRATLLAGVRSAVLWKQLGGSQWQILFKRKAFIEEAKKLLLA